MQHLFFDVLHHLILLRHADSERPKSILPAELLKEFTGVINVFAGVALERANKI